MRQAVEEEREFAGVLKLVEKHLYADPVCNVQVLEVPFAVLFDGAQFWIAPIKSQPLYGSVDGGILNSDERPQCSGIGSLTIVRLPGTERASQVRAVRVAAGPIRVAKITLYRNVSGGSDDRVRSAKGDRRCRVVLAVGGT